MIIIIMLPESFKQTSRIWTISGNIQHHNLSSVYTLSSHFLSVSFMHHTAVLTLGQYGVVLACVFNMTCTCFGPDKKLEPAYSTQKPSYSLLSSQISQVATCLPQREQNYNCLYTHSIKQHLPGAKQSQHLPGQSQLTPSILHTRTKHSQHLPD